ncbi:hypothetical protein [Lactococcus lactis]|nr:hypothetical protein [Lactococcus lactis]
MKTLGKAIANKIALVLSHYFQLPPGYPPIMSPMTHELTSSN